MCDGDNYDIDENVSRAKRSRATWPLTCNDAIDGPVSMYRYIVKCREVVRRATDRLFKLPHGERHDVLARFDARLGTIMQTLREIDTPHKMIVALQSAVCGMEWDEFIGALEDKSDRIEAQNYMLAAVDWVLYQIEEHQCCQGYSSMYRMHKDEFNEHREALLAVDVTK
jgi:hypothetical protein